MLTNSLNLLDLVCATTLGTLASSFRVFPRGDVTQHLGLYVALFQIPLLPLLRRFTSGIGKFAHSGRRAGHR